MNAYLATRGIGEIFLDIYKQSGLANAQWQNFVMLAIACLLVYLAIVKQYEPLLLLPIAFGMFIINIPGASDVLFFTGYDPSIDHQPLPEGENGGLFYFLYQGVSLVIYPPLIFLGIGAMTDFGPLIANPKSLLIGAGAQLGVFIAFAGALFFGFPAAVAAAIGIIGGADGPTAIYVASIMERVMSNLGNPTTIVPTIAIAAYSYMALIPVIQPPIMKLLTTKKERAIRMEQLRPVSKIEKIVFPLAVTAIIGILLPAAIPLLGMLMLGNLFKESGVVERLTKTATNELINIITILLGVTVGAKALGPMFLAVETLKIIGLGLFAFAFSTVGGLVTAKVINLFSKKKINPLIGSAGVSAVPMAARVAQKVGQETDPENYLLMHAMGPNVAGVIGSSIAAGVLLAMFGA